jgi:hypothetical protein
MFTSMIGYRYQKPDGKLFFRVSLGPLLFLDLPSDYFWRMDPKLYDAGFIALGFIF